MQCPNCGKENIDGARFCGGCGHKLELQAEVVEQPNETVNSTEATEAEQGETQPVEIQSAVEEQVEVQPIEQASTLPTPTTIINTVPTPVVPTTEPVKVKKKSKLPVLLIILVVIVAIGGAGYVFGKEYVLALFKTPEERLVDGFFNSFEARSGEIYTTIELEELELDTGDEQNNKDLIALIQDMKLETELIFDQNARELEGSLNLMKAGTSLVKVDYYLNDDYVIVDVPLLYDEPMYWELYALLDTARTGMTDGSFESNLSMFGAPSMDLPTGDTLVPEDAYIDFELLDESFEDYKELLDRDVYKSYDAIDWAPYKEVMVPYFETAIDSFEEDEYELEYDSDMSFKGVRYEIEYDYDDYNDMIFELVEVLADDDNLKAFIEEVVTTWFETVIENEDYAMYALLSGESMDDVDEWDSDFEDDLTDLQDEILDNINDGLDDLDDSIEEAKDGAYYSTDVDVDDLMNTLDVNLTYDLDDEGYLRSQATHIEGSLSDVMGGMDEMPISVEIGQIAIKSMVEFNNMDKEVDIEGIDKDDAVDVGSMNEEEMSEFQDELGANLIESLMSNPAFSEMLSGGMFY